MPELTSGSLVKVESRYKSLASESGEADASYITQKPQSGLVTNIFKPRAVARGGSWVSGTPSDFPDQGFLFEVWGPPATVE